MRPRGAKAGGGAGPLHVRHVDSLVAALATEQHGVVSRAHAVGHTALTWYSRLSAGPLASGPDAVLSHRTAAMRWGPAADRRGRRGPRARHPRPPPAATGDPPAPRAGRASRARPPDAPSPHCAVADACGFGPAETNVRVAGHRVDLVSRDARLIVEFDSWEFHRTRQACERDRRRDADHLATGYRTVRVTWRRLTREPLVLAARLGAALAAGQALAAPRPP